MATSIINLADLDGSNGFRMNGAAAGDFFCGTVNNARDINGDGFADLIVNVLDADPNGNFSESSYLVFGKVSNFSATLDLSSLDDNNGFHLDGVASGDFAGHSVSNAGDVNDNGLDDLNVGAPSTDPNGA